MQQEVLTKLTLVTCVKVVPLCEFVMNSRPYFKGSCRCVMDRTSCIPAGTSLIVADVAQNNEVLHRRTL